MDRKIRQIKLQCEREKKIAFQHMQKYLGRGPTSVPTWMAYNLNFTRELAAIWNGEQYLQMLKKYGRQFVLNPAQCRFLMASANERPDKIEKLVKVKNLYKYQTKKNFISKFLAIILKFSKINCYTIHESKNIINV